MYSQSSKIAWTSALYERGTPSASVKEIRVNSAKLLSSAFSHSPSWFIIMTLSCLKLSTYSPGAQWTNMQPFLSSGIFMSPRVPSFLSASRRMSVLLVLVISFASSSFKRGANTSWPKYPPSCLFRSSTRRRVPSLSTMTFVNPAPAAIFMKR